MSRITVVGLVRSCRGSKDYSFGMQGVLGDRWDLDNAAITDTNMDIYLLSPFMDPTYQGKGVFLLSTIA